MIPLGLPLDLSLKGSVGTLIPLCLSLRGSVGDFGTFELVLEGVSGGLWYP